MELATYKACICEGAAENAIMDVLLAHNLLIFSREEMPEEEIIRCREGKRFEEKYLRKGFADKISVIRILDSGREQFKISKAYAGKLDVINVITAPETEMLIILREDQYKAFKKAGKKPSAFCKEDLRMPDVKSYAFVKAYFHDPKVLVAAIKKYHKLANVQKANTRYWICCDNPTSYTQKALDFHPQNRWKSGASLRVKSRSMHAATHTASSAQRRKRKARHQIPCEPQRASDVEKVQHVLGELELIGVLVLQNVAQ